MTDTDLRAILAEIASRVQPVDLYQRSLGRSARIRRRRAAGGVGAGAIALVVIALASWQLLPPRSATPQPPAMPDVELTPAVNLDVVDDLASARLLFPSWPDDAGSDTCPAGTVTLSSAAYSAEGATRSIGLVDAVRIPLGDEPAYVVNARCFGAAEETAQVLAYRRDADGEYHLMAVVARTGGEIDALGALGYPGPDRVAVSVEHTILPDDGRPQFGTLTATRFYSWNGRGFVHSGGPTSFLVDEATARVTVSPSRMVVRTSGQNCRTASMTLTVTNHGPREARDVRAVIMYASLGLSPEAEGECSSVAGQGYRSTITGVGTLAPGTTRVITVTLMLGTAYPKSEAGRPWTEDDPDNVVALISGDQHWPNPVHFLIDHR